MKKVYPLLLMLFVFVAGSCSKYEEGSASLASKKSRLVNHWRTQQMMSNNTDITTWQLVTEVIIRDDNSITVKGNPFGSSTSSNGGWVFNGDKTRVLVTNNDGSLDDYEIVMLQKDEAKFRRTDSDGNTIFYHFVTY